MVTVLSSEQRRNYAKLKDTLSLLLESLEMGRKTYIILAKLISVSFFRENAEIQECFSDDEINDLQTATANRMVNLKAKKLILLLVKKTIRQISLSLLKSRIQNPELIKFDEKTIDSIVQFMKKLDYYNPDIDIKQILDDKPLENGSPLTSIPDSVNADDSKLSLEEVRGILSKTSDEVKESSEVLANQFVRESVRDQILRSRPQGKVSYTEDSTENGTSLEEGFDDLLGQKLQGDSSDTTAEGIDADLAGDKPDKSDETDDAELLNVPPEKRVIHKKVKRIINDLEHQKLVTDIEIKQIAFTSRVDPENIYDLAHPEIGEEEVDYIFSTLLHRKIDVLLLPISLLQKEKLICTKYGIKKISFFNLDSIKRNS